MIQAMFLCRVLTMFGFYMDQRNRDFNPDAPPNRLVEMTE